LLSKHSTVLKSKPSGVPNVFAEKFFFPAVHGYSTLMIQVLINDFVVGEAIFEIRDVLTTIKPTDLYLYINQQSVKPSSSESSGTRTPVSIESLEADSMVVVACIDFCHHKRYDPKFISP